MGVFEGDIGKGISFEPIAKLPILVIPATLLGGNLVLTA